MGTLHRMVDSRESQQTTRFRWRQSATGYWVWDTQPMRGLGQVVSLPNAVFMGDGSRLFCDVEGEDCLIPGTQRFYDALNGYFSNEQQEIAKEYFGICSIGAFEDNPLFLRRGAEYLEEEEYK